MDLTTIKNHLNLDDCDESPDESPGEEDDYLLKLLLAAQHWIENFTDSTVDQRQCVLETCHLTRRMELPVWPVDSIVSVEYTDKDGSHTLDPSEYRLIVRGLCAFLIIDCPPCTQSATITVVAGYDSVPEDICMAALLLIGDMFENREYQVTGAIISEGKTMDRLLQMHRRMTL